MFFVPIASGPDWAEVATAWATIALAVFALVGIIGLLFTRRALRESVNSRHAAIAVEVAQWWDRDMWK